MPTDDLPGMEAVQAIRTAAQGGNARHFTPRAALRVADEMERLLTELARVRGRLEEVTAERNAAYEELWRAGEIVPLTLDTTGR